MLSDTAIKALIGVAQDRLPDATAFGNFKTALLAGKITTSDYALIDAVANLSRLGIGPDEDLAAGFDALPDEAYTLGSDAHNFICRFIDRWALHHCTILGRIADRVPNLGFLDESALQPRGNYMAKLILDSLNISERHRQPWTYKSIADYGEEIFVRSGSVYGIAQSFEKSSGKHWEKEAQKELSMCVSDVIVFASAQEGLHLYAQNSSGEFEQVTQDDPDYSYSARFVDDAGTRALSFFDGPPEWTTRLHLYYPNWQAHNLMFRDCPTMNDALYQQWKDAHRRAVLLETREQERSAVSPEVPRDKICEHTDIEGPASQIEMDRLRYENMQLRAELEQARANHTSVATSVPEYLDPDHPRYSHRLVAAVRAWEAVTEPGNRGIKHTITTWLQDHAKELGQKNPDLPLSNKAIDDISTVVNWNQKGGAPKTC